MSAPFSISVTSDFERYARAYPDDMRKQVRFAAALALTKTAQAAQQDITAKFPTMFDRPTPATEHSLRVVPATKETLSASVLVKDWNGPAPDKWLAAEIDGGIRRHKRSEQVLIDAGIMEPDQFWRPGQGTEVGVLDQYGNIPGARIVQALSRVGAFNQMGFKANASAATKRKLAKMRTPDLPNGMVGRHWPTGTDYVVWHDKRDGRPKAIMQLLGTGDVEPILFFVDRQPDYRVRFPFNDMVLGAVEKHFAPEMAAALERAMSTARR